LDKVAGAPRVHLHRRTIAGVEPSPGTGRTTPTLVGRSAELDDLDDLLASAAAGVGAVVLLEGEAGVGRTSLVESLVPGAGLLGVDATLVRAAADDPPCAPLLAALPADVDTPADTGSDGSPDPLRVAELLRRRGAGPPWMLVVDDVHRADDATLAALTRLAGDGPLTATLLVLTLRPVPPRAAVQALVSAWVRAGARNLELRPLDPASALALAEAEAGARLGPGMRGAVATAGGNPRLVVAVVRAALDAGALTEVAPGMLDAVDQAWRAGLVAPVHEQLADLDDEVRALLAAAAVLGASFVVPDLAVVAELPVADCWRRLRHALAAGVVAARGDRLVFRHDVVRTVLYDDLADPVRRELHRRAAATLAAVGAPIQVIAAHLERAQRSEPS